jgi:CheY-like chemotaxis protein
MVVAPGPEIGLEKMGHTVLVAGNGLEVLRLVTEERLDLILMDVEMPEMKLEKKNQMVLATMIQPAEMLPMKKVLKKLQHKTKH